MYVIGSHRIANRNIWENIFVAVHGTAGSVSWSLLVVYSCCWSRQLDLCSCHSLISLRCLWVAGLTSRQSHIELLAAPVTANVSLPCKPCSISICYLLFFHLGSRSASCCCNVSLRRYARCKFCDEYFKCYFRNLCPSFWENLRTPAFQRIRTNSNSLNDFIYYLNGYMKIIKQLLER